LFGMVIREIHSLFLRNNLKFQAVTQLQVNFMRFRSLIMRFIIIETEKVLKFFIVQSNV